MAKFNPIQNLGNYAHEKGGAKKRSYEGSAKDRAEDKRGEKSTGMNHKAYESSKRDQAEDKRGARRMK